MSGLPPRGAALLPVRSCRMAWAVCERVKSGKLMWLAPICTHFPTVLCRESEQRGTAVKARRIAYGVAGRYPALDGRRRRRHAATIAPC